MDIVKPAPPQRPKAGHALASRMRELGLNQLAIGAALRPRKSQAWVSQSLFDDAEATVIRMVAKDPDNFSRLLSVLQWSESELYRATGLAAPPSRSSSSDLPVLPWRGGVRLPLYGTATAGIRSIEGHVEPERYIEFDASELPRGVNKDNLILLRVNGDSMYAEDRARSIPDGATAMIELWAAPVEGQIVLAWLTHRRYGELGVLKEFHEEDSVVLRSYRRGGPVFSITDPDVESMRVLGVVRRWTVEAP